MLTKLYIQNVALIDKVELDFGAGLNILTGETGAGKSIVVDSITAIIGGRLSKDLIRSGTEKAIIEGLFIINNEDKINELRGYGIVIEEDNSLLVVREFYQNGKNVCRANGRLVTVSALKFIGQLLVDIHGQHDNQSLLQTENHIDFLDAFIGEEIIAIKSEYTVKLNQLKTLRSELASLVGDPEERARKIDLLEFQIKEISDANLTIGEEDELIQKKLRLANAEKVANTLSNAYEILSGSGFKGSSIHSELNCVARDISQISFIDEKYSTAMNVLEEISYNIQELSRDIRVWRDDVEYNPQLLEQIEERLDLISRLKRKYGKDIDSILSYNDKIGNELEDIENSEERVKQISVKIDSLTTELIELSTNMSKKRSELGKVLESKIVKELEELEMRNTRFIVNVEFDSHDEREGLPQFNINGLNKVEFFISPNLGEQPKPLAKIASGGEMSRIMLAIKTILAKVDRKSILVFDEVDTGISGKTAQAVGEKLAYLAAVHQVVCVTHLAHIAAMADFYFNIEKQVEGDRTRTRVTKVDGEEESKALASILGGANITETTIKHAKEIKNSSNQLKLRLRNMLLN